MRSIPVGRRTAVAVLLLAMSLAVWSTYGRTVAAGQVVREATAAYGLAVTSADQDFVPSDRALRPPASRKWVVVSASLQNLQGNTVLVDAGALALVDRQGERYTAEAPSELMQPSLVGTTLVQGDWIRGLALFEVPVGTVAVRLEWCPAGPDGCVAPLSSPIPETPTGR